MNGLELLTLEMEKRDLQRRLEAVEQQIKAEEERREEEERRRKADKLMNKEMFIKVRVLERYGESEAHLVAVPPIAGLDVNIIKVRDRDLLERLPYHPPYNPFFHTW